MLKLLFAFAWVAILFILFKIVTPEVNALGKLILILFGMAWCWAGHEISKGIQDA